MQNETKKDLTKEEALQAFLETGEPAEETKIENEFDCDGGTFLVLTDEEADAAAAEYIKESLWSFNAEFLAAYTPEGIDAYEINALRGDRCEDANTGIVALVKAGCGLETLIEAAIGIDGRGHSLAHHDSVEHESACGDFYFYQV
tara:strand:+ start:285 stop:719 length:435 start_codon:yes stop_codon:yes gene_type:complete